LIRRAPLLLAAMIFCATVVGADNERPAPPKRRASVASIEAPDYPPEAVERGQTGRIVIEGVVKPLNGQLTDIEYRPDKPESSIFVDALKPLVPRWKFHPPLKGCIPTTERVAIEFVFSLDGGKPITFLSPPKAPARQSKVDPNLYRTTKLVKPTYSDQMAFAGWTSVVYARLEIDNSGKVVDVRTKAFSSSTEVEDDLELFRKAVVRAAGQWEFPPAPPGFKGPRVSCREFAFQLTNSPFEDLPRPKPPAR
jgi:hypothetical protein